MQQRLDAFLENSKIPNIIFHGEHGVGKKTVLFNFIHKIYQGNKTYIKEHVMSVNCAHGKGIKFVREELKHFAKSNILSKISFKSIVLLNADTLTIDAQSALRRCIELFTNNTRFFMVVENIDKLLMPILSRFCLIYVPQHVIPLPLPPKKPEVTKRPLFLKLINQHHQRSINVVELVELTYSQGFSALDILQIIQEDPNLLFLKNKENVAQISFVFGRLKKDFRNENILLFFLLNLFFISLDESLENITFL
jgi:hypothetical protein